MTPHQLESTKKGTLSQVTELAIRMNEIKLSTIDNPDEKVLESVIDQLTVLLTYDTQELSPYADKLHILAEELCDVISLLDTADVTGAHRDITRRMRYGVNNLHYPSPVTPQKEMHIT